MVLCRLSWFTPVLVSMALLLTSCASEPPVLPTGSSPNVRLGPVLGLLDFRTTTDRTDTLLDDQGYAHVFIAVASTKDIHHVVVSQEGAVHRELVETGSSPSDISAAFDRDGKLHLLLDSKHLVREGTTWRVASDTPWAFAAMAVRRPRFVQMDKGLVWTFLAEGKEVGVRGRWDWYGFGGGFGAGIIFPWHSASQKLVIVPEASTGDPLWYVLDPQDNLDISNAMSAADSHGNLHIVYDASRSGLAGSSQPRYARIDLMQARPEAERRTPDDTASGKTLFPVTGNQIPFFGTDPVGLNQAAAAVDPASGTVLVVRAHDASIALTHGNWSSPLPLPIARYLQPKLAPAGGEAFHLVAVSDTDVLYLLYARGSWSAPVALGKSSVASMWGSIWAGLDIASHGRNRAFAVWPTETGIVGRWVEGTAEIQAKPAGGATDHQGDKASVPRDLLDFSIGKAELITPGWTTGFAAATAAGANGQLTKELHDSGQWQALARVVLHDQYGDDLRWYYLGRAAEGLAWCDTAVLYYRVSLERSEEFSTRCLGIACHGFKLPELVEGRLSVIEAMRAAGKCSAPPVTNP